MTMSVNEMHLDFDKNLEEYVRQERAATNLIQNIGSLLYEKNIELVLFRNPLVEVGISELLNLHKYAKSVVNADITVFDTAEIAKELMATDLAPSKIDLGRLAKEYKDEKSNYASCSEFLKDKLSGLTPDKAIQIEPKDVVLYGFGRIGRLAARELIKQAGKGQQLRLRAIVTRDKTDEQMIKRAALMQNDSVHGTFKGRVEVDAEKRQMTVNGQIVKFISTNNPEDVDYTAYGINNAVLIDNTGAFTNREALSRHLQAKGIDKVILTAPGKEIPNIVYGVNHADLDIDNENIFSAASCTTNAIVPILKVINDGFGIEKGHIETVHAYTNDQNLLDNFHKKSRRGRSAAINMVITETGAGKAVTKVIPELSDKLTANAVRVPTPNGSLAILSLSLNKEVSVETVNSLVRHAALNGDLVNQINFQIDPELVSSDIIGNSCCSVFDSNATLVSNDKRNAVMYVWYDNEFGYTKQVIRLAKYIAKVRRLIYY